MKIAKPPVRPRDLFHLLALHDEATGLDGLLDRVDWQGVTPRQVYGAVLNRLPEAAGVALAGPDYTPRDHARAALTSDEFQTEIVARALAAYADKRRLLSVYTPFCGCEAVCEQLSQRFAWLDDTLEDPGRTTKAALIGHLGDFARETALSESLLLYGRYPLSSYVSSRAFRYGDRLFALVRHPFEIALAFADDLFSRMMAADPAAPDPELAPWYAVIGRDRLDDKVSIAELRKLSLRLLVARNGSGNPLCGQLGEGTAASAIDLLARVDIEVVDASRIDIWLEQAFGLAALPPPRPLHPALRLAELGPQQKRALAELCEQDVLLCDRIGGRLKRSAEPSLLGPSLAAS